MRQLQCPTLPLSIGKSIYYFPNTSPLRTGCMGQSLQRALTDVHDSLHLGDHGMSDERLHDHRGDKITPLYSWHVTVQCLIMTPSIRKSIFYFSNSSSLRTGCMGRTLQRAATEVCDSQHRGERSDYVIIGGT